GPHALGGPGELGRDLGQRRGELGHAGSVGERAERVAAPARQVAAPEIVEVVGCVPFDERLGGFPDGPGVPVGELPAGCSPCHNAPWLSLATTSSTAHHTSGGETSGAAMTLTTSTPSSLNGLATATSPAAS